METLIVASGGGAMSQEPSHVAATGAPARSWRPYPAYKDSGVEWLGKVQEQGNNANVIFWTGLTGSTGYVLSLDPVILSRINKPQIKANKRRLITSIHRKVGYKPRFINAHEKNTELKRTETNSSSVSSYGVRTSSLLIFVIPGREERKAQQHKSLSIGNIIRPGTRMTRIKRIFTDNPIRAHPRHPRNPCSIVDNSTNKIRYKWNFSLITEQEAAQ